MTARWGARERWEPLTTDDGRQTTVVCRRGDDPRGRWGQADDILLGQGAGRRPWSGGGARRARGERRVGGSEEARGGEEKGRRIGREWGGTGEEKRMLVTLHSDDVQD